MPRGKCGRRVRRGCPERRLFCSSPESSSTTYFSASEEGSESGAEGSDGPDQPRSLHRTMVEAETNSDGKEVTVIRRSTESTLTVVTDYTGAGPRAGFTGGDRRVEVTLEQLTAFLEDPLLVLNATVTDFEPRLREGCEEDVLVSKCRLCNRLWTWRSSLRLLPSARLSPACPNPDCREEKLGRPRFVFRLSLSHGSGLSSALLLRKHARHFLGCCEEEFVSDARVRARVRRDVEDLLSSDAVFGFCLRLVDLRNPFVYALENTRLVRT